MTGAKLLSFVISMIIGVCVGVGVSLVGGNQAGCFIGIAVFLYCTKLDDILEKLSD